MGKNRWEDISGRLHLAPVGASDVYAMVCHLSGLLLTILTSLTI